MVFKCGNDLAEVAGTHDVRSLVGRHGDDAIATLWHAAGKDGKLTLYDGDKNAVAEFEVVKQGLEGTSWEVTSYNTGTGAVTSVIIGTEITANFGEDGQLTGNAGCNNYSAQYETQGDNINIETAEVTEMACLEPEGIMEQEQLYLAALVTADTYKIEGMTMDMRTSEGSRVATFQRALNP